VSPTLNRLLDTLDEAKRQFGPGVDKLTAQILKRLAKREITDPDALIRFHETLLFINAYPQSASVKKIAESLLGSFAKRVATLREAGADLSPLETPEVSGITGTSVTDTFTYPIVRWLVEHQTRRVALDWDWFEDENRLAETWPRFMPLLQEDAAVEANVPYKKWLRAAKGPGVKDLIWLIRRFESLAKTEKEKAELYDSQNLYVRWTPAYRSTRTGMRLPVRTIFYHRRSLIQRREVSLKQELDAPPPVLKRLSSKQGETILDMAREASTVRYRELYGFTHGDREKVFKTHFGRGVDVFIMGLPPNRRLPLRAYHAAMFFKNGVPIGYFEGLSLFERMESGFNLYYSFRDGETAWLYARTLNIFRHLLGVTAFAIDPYQIGYENEEGIESGAFWFYRKLGFRPTSPTVMSVVLKEEDRIATRSSHRTSARRLRQLAERSMIYELEHSGDWDRFQLRNIGLAVQRRMAKRFAGDAERIRSESMLKLSRLLGIRTNKLNATELSSLADFAVTLSLVDDLASWSVAQKELLTRIIKAKAGADESSYLKLMQKHARLRSVMIRLGSK
jgi:hypothetical protein